MRSSLSLTRESHDKIMPSHVTISPLLSRNYAHEITSERVSPTTQIQPYVRNSVKQNELF